MLYFINMRKKIRKVKSKNKILTSLKDRRLKFKSNFALAGYFLGFIFLVIIISGLWQWRSNSLWLDNSQINFVTEYNNNFSIIKLDKNLEEVMVVNLPSNMMIGVTDGYGEYKLNKIKELFNQEKINLGEYLKDSVTIYFGVLIDGYFVNIEEDNFNIKRFIKKSFFKINKTNINRIDLAILYFYLNNLGVENFKTINLIETNLIDLEKLSDDSEVYRFNEVYFDDYVLRNFANYEVLKDSSNWEVFNGTDYVGFGSQIGRVLSNTGLNVVGVRQAKDNYKESFILVKDDYAQNYSVEKIAKYLRIPIRKLGEVNDFKEELFNDRAEVAMIIGEDLGERIN